MTEKVVEAASGGRILDRSAVCHDVPSKCDIESPETHTSVPDIADTDMSSPPKVGASTASHSVPSQCRTRGLLDG
jgi:hypothetical protein